MYVVENTQKYTISGVWGSAPHPKSNSSPPTEPNHTALIQPCSEAPCGWGGMTGPWAACSSQARGGVLQFLVPGSPFFCIAEGRFSHRINRAWYIKACLVLPGFLKSLLNFPNRYCSFAIHQIHSPPAPLPTPGADAPKYTKIYTKIYTIWSHTQFIRSLSLSTQRGEL